MHLIAFKKKKKDESREVKGKRITVFDNFSI